MEFVTNECRDCTCTHVVWIVVSESRIELQLVAAQAHLHCATLIDFPIALTTLTDELRCSNRPKLTDLSRRLLTTWSSQLSVESRKQVDSRIRPLKWAISALMTYLSSTGLFRVERVVIADSWLLLGRKELQCWGLFWSAKHVLCIHASTFFEPANLTPDWNDTRRNGWMDKAFCWTRSAQVRCLLGKEPHRKGVTSAPMASHRANLHPLKVCMSVVALSRRALLFLALAHTENMDVLHQWE